MQHNRNQTGACPKKLNFIYANYIVQPMGVTDFIVPYSENAIEMGNEVIRHLTVNRINSNKPVIILLVGGSGEGKSYTGLKIMDVINKWHGIKTSEHLEDQVVYTPLEYADKMDAILHDKDKKKLKVLMIDEAREIVSSALWYSFVNRAIADVNALHRTIKPIVLIVVVQSIKDVDPSTRRTVQYYFKCARPLGKSVNLYPFRLWHDDRNLDAPRLRKRTLRGYYVKDHHKVKFRPKKMIITKPPNEITKPYDKINKDRKSKILKKKFETLITKIQKEVGIDDRVEKLVDWYMTHPELFDLVNKRYRGRIRVDDGFKARHGLTKVEIKEFEIELDKRIQESDMVDK